MKTTIYLIRHGQTEWNVERRMQGRADSPLTLQGVEAAERLAPKIPPVSAVYSSPSGRTMQTARILFGSREVVVCDDRLLEINLGDWEGRLQADLDLEDPEQHPNFWKAPHLFKKEGAETFSDVAGRAAGFLDEISGRHAGQSVAVVSHTTVIRSMLFSVEPRDLSGFWRPPAVYPASISEVVIVDGVSRIVRFGCTAHHEHSHCGAY
ncbi:histidine phosphatase family protein [Tichowtungia aerotolerans]|uniref:Histidine phosphatase family protein n=1 Tax=Tichowtungia aerotolerans TaxID=2697043 RepID=A0A6P1M8R1_9BACT|nr:histidine phosphatase family protein [Tichowtungia aerotolerans]QHI70412.1 histidine phosphatase family protein [Tichowtungia aerotolerans]